MSVLGWMMVASAWAGTAPEPVIESEAGPLRLAAGFAALRYPERDLECGDADACEGWWTRTQLLLEGQVVLLDGVAIYGEGGQSNERLAEANYRGGGPYWGLGVRLSTPLPVESWSLGAHGGLSWAWGEGGSLDSGGIESSWAHVHEVGASVAWGRRCCCSSR